MKILPFILPGATKQSEPDITNGIKPDANVISRRNFVQQASLAAGASIAAPLTNTASALGKWGALPVGKGIRYAVLKPGTNDGLSAPGLIDGIPFLQNTLLTSLEEGGSASLTGLNVEAKYLYLRGCGNSIDVPHNNWGGADDLKNQFIGDKAGSLHIQYLSSAVDSVPLLFGYTLWWCDGYNASPEPFKSDFGKRAILDRALCVANGLRGEKDLYYLRIVLRDEPVLEIALGDNAEHAGRPIIDGITFGDVSNAGILDASRFVTVDGGPMEDGLSAWLSSHSVESTNPLPLSRQDALRDLSHVIYTFPSDIDARTIRQVEPVVLKQDYAGPEVKFEGPPEADILTNVFMDNSNELLERIDDSTGMVHESAIKSPNYMGWVGYLPDLQPYYDDSYTRTHFIALLSNMGFLAKANKAIDYFDRWMMYFPNSYPALQIGGKPVPGHATVIANKPHVYFDKLRKLGWPEKFKTRDYGNPETDGHGLLMLSRWRAWTKGGRTRAWLEQRWQAVNEAAEWIGWCLDNPQLSLSEHGLLYSESEGGMAIESLYCNVPCYFGLLAYAEMAQVAQKADAARRWRDQAGRLLGAMNAHFPSNQDPWGDVWDPTKTGGWGLATASVPILEGMELYGYDAIHHLPAGWAERTKRTYAMQSSKRKPQFCDPSAMGYGQGFITQSAFLLDRMEDATHMTEWMARFCFAPRQPHPYRVPESVVMKSNESMWARGGDLGNGFQMGEVLVACHILVGIDDYDAATLKIMPRLPAGWTGCTVRNWPVRVSSSGESEMVSLSMEVSRDRECTICDLKISVDKRVDRVDVRLGPFPKASRSLTVKNYRAATNAILFESGDSKWAWIHVGTIHDSCLIQSQTE